MNSFTRFALILAGVAAATGSLSAQTPTGNPSPAGSVGPILKFTTETYDFGKILAGETVSYTFVMTNAGDAPLDILGVKPGCSCTVVNGSWTQHIAPHETGTIPVSVRTSGRGPIDKTIAVTSSDTHRATVLLHLKGTLWVPIEIAPPSAYFSVNPDAETVLPEVLKIFNRTDEPLILSVPQSSSPAFSAVLTTNEPGREFELQITVTPPAPNGIPRAPSVLNGTISLTTSSSNMPTVRIMATANIKPEIEFQPRQMQMQNGPTARGLTNYITILNNTSAPLKLLDASVNVPGVGAVINMVSPNISYNVAVGFPPGFELKAGQKMAVSIKTDNPRFPTIEVPVLSTPPIQPILRRPLPAPGPLAAPVKS